MGEAALRALVDHGFRLAISLSQFPRITVQADDLRRRILQIGIQSEGATQCRLGARHGSRCSSPIFLFVVVTLPERGPGGGK